MTGLYVASNVPALSAQFNLTRNMGELSSVLNRLSTGLRINSGKDDPAGLIASELLKAEITGTTKAISNTQRANGMIATADASLGQISNLLNDVKGLVVEAANTGAMSADQIRANQLQVDGALESIDRIARSTTYAGQRLLDGSLDFRTNLSSGGGIENLSITSANFGNANAIDVDVRVLEAARKGTLFYNGDGVSQRTTLDVTGSIGTKTFTFGAGTTNDQMALAINAASDSTGVAAFVEGKAARGSVVLSTAGANNDILITANKEGLDAGNYTFRITEGTTNDVRIVSDPAGTTPGVVEISLVNSTETSFNGFAGLFNITIDAMYDGSGDAGDTSVSMTRGNSNKVQFFDTDTNTVGSSKSSGVTLSVSSDVATSSLEDADVRVSDFNGWTVKVDTLKASETDGNGGDGDFAVDLNNKTIYLAEEFADADGIAAAFTVALGATDELDGTTDFTLSGLTGDTLTEGDSITLGAGGNAGELFIQYAAGATAGDIMKMINNAPNVQATLKQGVSASDVIANLPNGETRVAKADTEATVNKFTSGATSQEVIDLINSKLGDVFTATALTGGGSGGRVSYMDASVVHGDINLDNALRFSGMDNGPLVRLSNLNSDGSKAINQELGIRILQPSEADIRSGITTPILEIQLATDAAGNSITTAKDVADLFNRLTPMETLGVSASVLYPPGVDPNGRVWYTDNCGNEVMYEDCPAQFGLGIVQPTGYPDVCGSVQNDLVLLGNNQKLVADYAVARIQSDIEVDGVGAIAGANDAAEGTSMDFGDTSALNGMTFAFTMDERKEGFDKATGTLTIFLNPTLADDDDDGLKVLIDSAIAANWEGIRAYTGSTLLAPGAEEKFVVDSLSAEDAKADAAGGGMYKIVSAYDDPADWDGATLGVGANDPAMTIKAKDLGTDMAGVKVYFVQDETVDAWDGDTATMKLDVTYNVLENGEKQLIVRGNMGEETVIDGVTLAKSLNNNEDFQKLFEATATLNDYFDPADGVSPDEAAGAVAFRAMNWNNPNGVTEGGYRIESDPSSVSKATATSNGISMVGQSDSNERLVLQATEFGSDNFVKVSTVEGSFDTYCTLGYQMNYLAGTDITATINGIAATGRGANISISTADLAMSMDVANQAGARTGFTIQGGGALFQLGPDVISSQQIRVGIGSMLTSQLGGLSGRMYQLKSGGNADLVTSDASRKLADRIVNEAINNVAMTRGRLGAIQRSTLEPNISMLQDSLTALTESEAMYSNADFAQESSNLMRLQLLVQSGMQTLGIANQFPQYAASLIR